MLSIEIMSNIIPSKLSRKYNFYGVFIYTNYDNFKIPKKKLEVYYNYLGFKHKAVSFFNIGVCQDSCRIRLI